MSVSLVQKRAGAVGYFLLVMLAACGCARAVAPGPSGNPYSTISQRNVFDLRAPFVPPVVAPKPPVLPKITLTGITTILGRKIAFITVNGSRPGERPRSLMLAEGQGQDDIRVKHIDVRTGTVSSPFKSSSGRKSALISPRFSKKFEPTHVGCYRRQNYSTGC